MNLGIFSGNLGRDSEQQHTAKDSVLNFSIGVNVGTKDKEETMWVSCALWGKRGDALKQYLVKGVKVTVSGQVKLRTYKKKDGTDGTDLAVTVQEIDLHGARDKSAAASVPSTPAGEPAKANGFQPQGDIDAMDDDIPF